MVEKNFLIAEAGINHNGNIKTALKLVDTAKEESDVDVALNLEAERELGK